ncbi:MAG: hypothetical protein ISN64_00195 [Rickettsia sp.]|nr:hypothetical protein [Rickettsia sp.]
MVLRFKRLVNKSTEYLKKYTVGIDRGVKIASQIGDLSYNLDKNSQK